MYRGTTPIHTFTFPENFPVKEYAFLYITYAQCGEVRCEKCLNDGVIENNRVQVRLEQAETLSFFGSQQVDIQLRVKSKTGDAYASNIITVPVGTILKDGEI